MRLAPRLGQDGVLRFEPGESARDMRVVTEVDGDAFAELWLSSVEALLR